MLYAPGPVMWHSQNKLSNFFPSLLHYEMVDSSTFSKSKLDAAMLEFQTHIECVLGDDDTAKLPETGSLSKQSLRERPH
jgi:hypothetical protein